MLMRKQKGIAYKYVVRYPHLATLAKWAETDPRAAKALGDAMMDLEYPHDLTEAIKSAEQQILNGTTSRSTTRQAAVGF